uniref:Uncharacterized protein n=1 Tax=Oryza rufipogon TaxID=4529 RepID=A0A0E0R960_ORYRU
MERRHRPRAAAAAAASASVSAAAHHPGGVRVHPYHTSAGVVKGKLHTRKAATTYEHSASCEVEEWGYELMIFFLRVDYQDSDTRKGNRRTRGCERGSKTLGSSADLIW